MKSSSPNFASIKGFSLLELIIVIVLMGIMAISLSNVTTNAVYGYIDAKDRNSLSQSAKWVTEKISREMREALPQSVRTGTSGTVHCVEFMSILNASTYLNLPASGPIDDFNAVAYNLAGFTNSLIAIMPINPIDVYDVNSGTTAPVDDIIADVAGEVTVNLTGTPTFARRSPTNRFYVLTTPTSFCLNDSNGELHKYSGYAIKANLFPLPIGGSSLMGENFRASGAVFNYQDGTLSRAALLQINLKAQNRSRNLTGNEESFEVFHEVHVRNVP